VDYNVRGANQVIRNLIKVGSGTQIFTGNNTYSGVTQVQGGTLQIGDGGTTGTSGGHTVIVTDGTLAINRSDTVTFNQNDHQRRRQRLHHHQRLAPAPGRMI
jgi:autotransporter-associated beta strand protein